MTILGASTVQAEKILDAASAELETVEPVMSLFRPDSQLCRLNRDRILDRSHPYFVQVLLTVSEMFRQSDDAFDVTVEPLWDLFASSSQRGELPADDEVFTARESVDGRAIKVALDRIRLRSPARAVTLNGIAPGFAADRAVAALRQHRIEHALVNSGEVGCLVRKSNGGDWCRSNGWLEENEADREAYRFAGETRCADRQDREDSARLVSGDEAQPLAVVRSVLARETGWGLEQPEERQPVPVRHHLSPPGRWREVVKLMH